MMKNMSMIKVVLFLLVAPYASAFFNFGQRGPQHQQQANHNGQSYEDTVLHNKCQGYLCPDTLECVNSANDCPCPFPKSQLRCSLPNGEYVCISKPSYKDNRFHEIYDDQSRNMNVKVDGYRDCGWVMDQANI